MKTAESKPQSASMNTSSSLIGKNEEQGFFDHPARENTPFFRPKSIQPKLEVGQPGDKYEQEADQVADAVMRMPDPQIQRQPVEEEKELQMKQEPDLQRKCKECEEEEKLQKKSDGNTQSANHASSEISSQLSSRSGTGSRLPNAVQSEMGTKIGADFSGVNIHTDATSYKLNRQLGARAFTHGSDIYFNKGEYNPASDSGKHLLAHELTHVVQQSKDGSRSHPEVQRACGSAEIGNMSDCIGRGGDIYDFGYSRDNIYLFNQSCDDFLPGEEERLRSFASTVRPNDTLEIDGFASEEGPEDFNRNLSCARTLKAAAILSSEGLTSRQISGLFNHGATQGDRSDRRSVVITVSRHEQESEEEPPAEHSEDIKVVVKSYIAPIGSRVGMIAPSMPPLVDPITQARLRALALVTDASYSENPSNDRKDKGYRLYSERTFRVTCHDGNLTDVIPMALDTDAGTECIPETDVCLQPPDLITSNVETTRVSPTEYKFEWFAKGRPHAAAEPVFQAVHPRTSFYIWHSVRGSITCSGSTPNVTIELNDSRFPSDRVFVNNSIERYSRQGTFSNLWDPHPSDPFMVR